VSRNTLATIAVAALAMPVFSACADDTQDEPATPRAAAATAAPAAKIARELIGSWKTRLPLSEIPDVPAPPNAPGPGPKWEIEFLEDGGPGNAPALVYANEAGIDGALPYEVNGDRIKITDDNCSSGPSDGVYAFAVHEGALTFETVENHCPEQVMEQLLTARPWRR
jgi:hypothetical protein